MTLTHDVTADEASLCRRIESEFRELPALCLTTHQAARLWQVDLARCRSALRHLESVGFLRRVGERYRRVEGGRRGA